MLAICRAAERLGNYRLPGCTLFVTLEPCIMCAGVCIQARIARIVYGTDDPRAGALHSCYAIGRDDRLNHDLTVAGGLMAGEYAALLRDFFRARRQKSL